MPNFHPVSVEENPNEEIDGPVFQNFKIFKTVIILFGCMILVMLRLLEGMFLLFFTIDSLILLGQKNSKMEIPYSSLLIIIHTNYLYKSLDKIGFFMYFVGHV